MSQQPRFFRRGSIAIAALACAVGLLASGRVPQGSDEPTLEEARLTMSKWMETQQIISKERSDWQQGKEILNGRLELVRKEASTLDQSIRESQQRIAETDQKRDELRAESAKLEALGAQLAEAVTQLEGELRRLRPSLPEPVQAKIQQLYERMPADEAALARVSVAERFQNVLGILTEITKASSDITVNFEVRTLSDGKPSEVRALYVGLTSAYYVNANGEAGIGAPSESGWKWEPSKAIADDLLTAFDILAAKHSPAFVPLPVKLP
jgi:flagellar motility protein MotE (MotC chaperone)